jgi:heme/copper-type cytochrome/quinol oxidase subunit 1
MFTRVVFALAGILGLGVLVVLYQEPGSYTYYGLLGGLAAWQILFLLIAWRPAELRLAMIPAVLEKLLWVITLVVLYGRGGLTAVQLAGGTIPNGLLGVLFVVAYFRTSLRVTQARSG